MISLALKIKRMTECITKMLFSHEINLLHKARGHKFHPVTG